MEVTRRRGRRRKKLLDDLKDRRGGNSRSHYVEESFWRRLWTCRQTETEWMNEWMCFDTYFIHYYMTNKSSKPLWTSKLFTIFQYFLTVHDSDVSCWKPKNSQPSNALSCLRLGHICAWDLFILKFPDLRFLASCRGNDASSERSLCTW